LGWPSPAEQQLNRLLYETALAYADGTEPPPAIDLAMAACVLVRERNLLERYAGGWFARLRGWACKPDKECESCARDFRGAAREWFIFNKGTS